MSGQARAKILRTVADLIERDAEEFVSAEVLNTGKGVRFARTIDIPRSAYNFRFFADLLDHHITKASQQPSGTCFAYTVREPVGVAGVISPWNLPLYLLSWKLAPAIAFGNTCVCKPSEFTSLTAWMLAQRLQEAGMPPGVCNFVFGTGPRTGAALVQHPDVPLISFTGGTASGLRVQELAAPLLKRVSLELGGKNPTIVFDDVDLAKSVESAVRAAFSNQGQICLSGSRVLVHTSIYDQFLREFVAAAEKLVVGDPCQESTDIGAVINKAQYEKIMSYLEMAVALGGRIETGGPWPTDKRPSHLLNGLFIRPTVITGLDHQSRVCQEEIFGPVVTVHRFSSEAEAVALANATKYGLSASLWTENLGRAHRVAKKLQCGTVWVNCWMVRDLNMPVGGYKMSGIGREGAENSWHFFTEEKAIFIEHG